MKKPKLEVLSSKSSSVKSSFSASSKAGNPLLPRRDYKKKGKNAKPDTEISFGQTGLTGRS